MKLSFSRSFPVAGVIAWLAAGCIPEDAGPASCETPEPSTTQGLRPHARVELDWKTAFTPGPEAVTVRDEVVGVSLSHPKTWRITRDPYLFETHGFMLREADLELDDAHGPLPVARIALDYSARASDIDAIIQSKRDEYPGVPMREREVTVGGRPAIALGPVPGGQVSTNVYFSVGDRVYRINYYGEELDERGQAVLDALEFSTPTRSVESLDLPIAQRFRGIDLDRTGKSPESEQVIATSRSALEARTDECEESVAQSALASNEYRIAEGCWAQPTWFFIQTTHSWDANGDGWSRMGTPNFWGDNTHGNWGLGRCVSTYYTNDLYAIDYFVDAGDRLISPFAAGYVRYAGWDPENWWNYGNMVVISDPSGKYWSLSAHLRAVNVYPGQYVDEDTLIGWAGSTGYADPYPHVHQVFYRWPSSSYGRPYGGQGLKQTRLRFAGNGGGAYSRFWKGKWVSW